MPLPPLAAIRGDPRGARYPGPDEGIRQMRVVYGISLAVGVVALIGWLGAVAISNNVTGWDRFDPDERLSMTGRRGVAALFGFGMAGLSASYAGWSTLPALAAAAGGVVVGVLLAGSSE